MSVYVDYRNNSDLTDKNTMIYGHNMQNVSPPDRPHRRIGSHDRNLIFIPCIEPEHIPKFIQCNYIIICINRMTRILLPSMMIFIKIYIKYHKKYCNKYHIIL